MNPLTAKEAAGETSSSEIVDGRSQRTFDKEPENFMMKYVAHTVDIPNTNASSDSLPYLFGNKEDYLNLVVPLYQASVTGDWETAKAIFNKRPNLVVFGLSKNIGTALHVAVTTHQWTNKNTNFVRKLVDMLTVNELEVKNKDSNTAFWVAASCGNIEAVKIMFEKNPNLLNIRGSDRLLPFSISAKLKNSATAMYLYQNSHKLSWINSDDRDDALYGCILNDRFDIALQILKDTPHQALNVSLLLPLLAPNLCAFRKVDFNIKESIISGIVRFCGIQLQSTPKDDRDALKILKIIWEHAMKTMEMDEIVNMIKESRVLFAAAESGNTNFIVELLRTYPDLMLDRNDDGHTIFHIAVMHRHEDIYNLMYEIGECYRKDIFISKDKLDNNILHLVGKSSKHTTSKMYGSYLPMQWELLWFNEITRRMPYAYLIEAKNKDGKTPIELFFKENEEQVSSGLKWMKDCMVVATLIVTVAFAVAFAVPGGYKEDDGVPIFIYQDGLIIFVIASAISLFSSSTSLLVFLSILTSHHHQIEFMQSLPSKLMIGLITLMMSVSSMMITFSASFFMVFHKGLKWVPITIAAFSAVPCNVFGLLQLPLLVFMFRCMYDPHYVFKPKKRMLYTQQSSQYNKSS